MSANLANKTPMEAIIRSIDGIIHELERLKERVMVPGSQQGSSLTPDETVRQRETAQRLVAHWRHTQGDGIYRGRGFAIDLHSTEGRAQMLVLANLLAAKVRDEVAEQTFIELSALGLLQAERLAKGSPEDRALALDVLQASYKAVTDKAAKVQAIYDNQVRLATEWQGDLNNIYAACAGDDGALLRALQSFAHLKRRAVWLIREFRAHGVWTTVGREASAYYDRHVYRVLDRLGMGESPSGDRRSPGRHEGRHVVSTLFAGDVVPLYLHGSRLCIHDDHKLCAGMCPVKENCTFWTAGAEQSAVHITD